MDNYDHIYMGGVQADADERARDREQIRSLRRALIDMTAERDRLLAELEHERNKPTPDDRDRY